MPDQCYNIWTDNNYVYAATYSGLDVISLETEQTQSFAYHVGGYTSVWANSDYVYVGTSSSGISRLSKLDIGPEDISDKMYNYLNVPDLVGYSINYIHGNDNIMVVTDDNGVNILHFNSNFISNCTVSGAGKCFVTESKNDVYYIVANTEIHKVTDRVTNWSTPDKIYDTDEGILLQINQFKDIFVTANTSLNGQDNTLFMATDDGVYILDEGSGYALKYTITG